MREGQKPLLIYIDEEQKAKWKSICKSRGITFKSLIVDSVEGRIMDNERRRVIEFIEVQDNIFKKIENNINQFAKIANTSKWISEMEMKIFNQNLSELRKMKQEQTDMFKIIFEMLGK
ncbi:hypothetical protein [Bergeyella sp. RCAD1439]|uniref:hypothetical protein n=1 Tax=Bergeyella anatis TaxID=3113737 RepID=UPI002E18900F|nr:hypothetical protein [Bergeyella sp. RCAD1439]